MQTAQFALHADIEEKHWWFVARRRILRKLVQHLVPPDPRAVVVDIGCGTGANIASLGDLYQGVGIDTSEEAIALARRRFPHVEFVHGHAPADLGPLAAKAKLFLLMDVLEHVEDDFFLLSQLLTAASPDAVVLITVPADNALWSEHDESFGHFRRYDLPRLCSTWDGLAVSTLLASPFNARLYPLVLASRWNSRRKGKAAGAAGTDFWLPARPMNALLERVFAGEGPRLVRSVGGRAPYRRGVSLVAILRREAGVLTPRTKPSSVAPDRYDPRNTRPRRAA